MRKPGSLLIPLLVGCTAATAAAGEEQTVSVAVLRDTEHPEGRLRVATEDGKRRVLRGRLALAVGKENEVFTVGATLSGRTLEVHSVQATVCGSVRLNSSTRLTDGAVVKVTAHRVRLSSAGTLQRNYRVTNGRRSGWLNDYQLKFKPSTPPLRYSRIAGRIEVKAGKPWFQSQIHGRFEVLGPNKSVLTAQKGRFVSGFGLVFQQAKKLLLTQLDGTTAESTDVHRAPDSSSESMPFGAREKVAITGVGPKGEFLRVHLAWPGTEETRGYIPAKHVSTIGREWRDVTGKLTQLPSGDLAIQTSSTEQQLLSLGGYGTLPKSLLQPHLHKTLTVGGLVDSRNTVEVKSVSAVVAYALPAASNHEAIPRGTTVQIKGVTLGGSYLVTLPTGDPLLVPTSSLHLQAKTGAAAILRRLP